MCSYNLLVINAIFVKHYYSFSFILLFPVPLVSRDGRGMANKIKTIKIKEYKSFFPLIYIFSAFIFIFTSGGDARGGDGYS